MPSFDQLADQPRKGKIIKSAFDSDSFESDGTIHVDGLVGSATISPSGRDVALASPDGLAIIDLDSPYNPPRRLRSHGLPWLVVDVQWSPFAARDYWVVSTANHHALVWNLNLRDDSSSGAIEHSLQGHSRAITDVNFSAHHPDLLATCSVDGYVHWWDLRRPRQPALTFCDWFAGATQVKFNRQDPHVIASAHDRWLHIWDERRPSEPLKSISAHTSKIYGIDWNRTRSTGIVTCSLDKSIKFWDYGNDEDPLEHVIRTDFPVWRARHTPFGWGLLAMPQNEPGDLYLYDRLWSEDGPVDCAPDPVAVFPGHGEHKAKEFLWRSRGSVSDDNIDHRDFQLVSWGTDNELRLHCIDNNAYSAVGHTKDGPARKELKLTREGAPYKTFRAVHDHSSRDRKSGKMSDPRSGVGIHQRQSALTAGMKSSSSQYRQVRPTWRGPSMKARASSGKRQDRSQAQLGWMKGIMMTKRKASADVSQRHLSKDSSFMGHSYLDDEWGEPDTIQEEVLNISNQLPKVNWEHIDMDNLTLNASLTGPWGVGGEPIFIKVKIDIPAEYPKRKAPTFDIEKTSFMPEETHKRIDRELHQLVNQFLQRKQNCLEVAFTYLLGEVDLESSTTFFKNVRDFDDGLDDLADESSSDDDEDMPAEGSATMSQELAGTGDVDAALVMGHRNVVPPTPRTCGARFASDGRLVCFFPSKEERARAFFTNTADMYKERAKGEPFFAGFGRLAQDSLSRHRLAPDETSATDDMSEDSESGNSSVSSTDSESTSIHKLNFWYKPSRQLRRTWSEDRSVRSSGGGTGTGIGTGTGTGTLTSRRRFGRPRNVLHIYNLRAELPSKKEFAEEYAIFGDGADVCDHNAQVAAKYDCPELVDVWHYLALLLRKGIPLEILSDHHRRDSILVIARDVVSTTKKLESHLSERPAGRARHGLKGRVKWGRHPLAKDFVTDLFVYFEKMADIQMLAMLSCIFGESSADDSVAYAESRLPEQETPLPLKAPSFSLDYFPADASAWNAYGRSFSNSGVTTPGTLHTPIHYGGSGTSDEFLWSGDPATSSYSCGETPPSKAKVFPGEGEEPHTVSKSPTTRATARLNSGFASALTANFPRSFTAGASTSPPNNPPKKKPSPAEAILNTLAPGATNVNFSSSHAGRNTAGTRASLSEDDFRRDIPPLPLVPINVSVFLEDQAIFDDDGWMGANLLEQSRAGIYANYRYAYAEMLQIWNQPLARLEIMKFNVLKDNHSSGGMDGSFHESVTIHDSASANTALQKSVSSPIVMGRKDQLYTLVASGRGLDVTGVCRVHETQLEPTRYTSTGSHIGGAVGSCDRCRRTQTQLHCVYCLEPVAALFPPCLSCGCASHAECLAEWHAAGESYCPAGDECNCVEFAADGKVESWAALKGAMLKGQVSHNKNDVPHPSVMNPSDDDDDSRTKAEWERVEANVPSRFQGLAPSPSSLSLGRFKKSAGAWSRPSSLRRNGRRGA